MDLFIALFAAVLVAVMLEAVGWARRRHAAAEGADAEPTSARERSVERTLLRLAAAVFAGFVLGGVTAGMLERGLGVEAIELFTWRANALIAAWTGVVWWYLVRRAPF